jgi:dihydroorotate dehydrogenase (NAD+) catalytic subunit
MLSVSSPLYDISKTFEENFSDLSFPLITPSIRSWPPKKQWTSLFGFPLASRVGAAACAATTGKGISCLAQLGFDVLTYKTIRRQAYPTHPLPNIVHVDVGKLLDYSDLEQVIYEKDKPCTTADKIAISNSFGNGCLQSVVVIQDIAFAKKNLSEGQVLIVSVYGEGGSSKLMAKDFAETAIIAKEAGADIVELNFSCPNLLKSGEPLFCNAEYVYQVTSQVVKCVGDIPILLKLGLLREQDSPDKLLIAAARAGARGISAINSISMRVLNRKKLPAFGERIYSGVSGYPIRQLALQCVEKLAQINQKEKLNLVILGMGGITLPEHFNEFFNVGADIALSATGMMWNPYLATQFHQQIRS